MRFIHSLLLLFQGEILFITWPVSEVTENGVNFTYPCVKHSWIMGILNCIRFAIYLSAKILAAPFPVENKRWSLPKFFQSKFIFRWWVAKIPKNKFTYFILMLRWAIKFRNPLRWQKVFVSFIFAREKEVNGNLMNTF